MRRRQRILWVALAASADQESCTEIKRQTRVVRSVVLQKSEAESDQRRSGWHATAYARGAWRKEYMSWFKRQENEIETNTAEKNVRTEGLWQKCEGCGQYVFKADLEANLQVCPKCGHHLRLDARSRIASLLEPGYELVDLELVSTDPLEFVDIKPYRDRLEKARRETGLNDAVMNALGNLGPHAVVLSVMEFAFIGGSMGCVVGETIARAIDRALAGKAAAHHRCRVRRRTHDGRGREPDAIG